MESFGKFCFSVIILTLSIFIGSFVFLKLMESFGKFCFSVIILTLSIFIGSFVFLKLYEWFIIKTFNTPNITIVQAIGVMLFIGYLKPRVKKDGENFSMEKFFTQFIELIIMALFVLSLGYLIHQFI